MYAYVCMYVCVTPCWSDRTNKCFPIDMYGSGQHSDEIQSHARAHNLPACRLHADTLIPIDAHAYIHTCWLISSARRTMRY